MQRLNQRFRLTARSQNGSVTVYIPNDFRGLATFKTTNGRAKFSQGVAARRTHSVGTEKDGKAYIGALALPEDRTGKPLLEGEDELELWSQNGNITIAFWDEVKDSDQDGLVAGWMKSLFGTVGAASAPSAAGSASSSPRV